MDNIITFPKRIEEHEHDENDALDELVEYMFSILMMMLYEEHGDFHMNRNEEDLILMYESLRSVVYRIGEREHPLQIIADNLIKLKGE